MRNFYAVGITDSIKALTLAAWGHVCVGPVAAHSTGCVPRVF